jgi:hypothetical protein
VRHRNKISIGAKFFIAPTTQQMECQTIGVGPVDNLGGYPLHVHRACKNRGFGSKVDVDNVGITGGNDQLSSP